MKTDTVIDMSLVYYFLAHSVQRSNHRRKYKRWLGRPEVKPSAPVEPPLRKSQPTVLNAEFTLFCFISVDASILRVVNINISWTPNWIYLLSLLVTKRKLKHLMTMAF